MRSYLAVKQICQLMSIASTWSDNEGNRVQVEEQRVLDGSFNRQLSLDETNDMKTTVITDFFRRA